MSEAVNDANQAVRESCLGGYCSFNLYKLQGLQVTLDGDFDIDDIRRVLHYMEMIEEEQTK